MSHILFHNPPAIGAGVQIYYKPNPQAKDLLLLGFIGDGFTTGFTIPGHTFDASKISIIINDNFLPVSDWSVKEDRWLDSSNNTSSKNKSVILFNTESEQYKIHDMPVYSAEFRLCDTDYAETRDELECRIYDAMDKCGRLAFRIDWDNKHVYYTKVKT